MGNHLEIMTTTGNFNLMSIFINRKYLHTHIHHFTVDLRTKPATCNNFQLRFSIFSKGHLSLRTTAILMLNELVSYCTISH